MSAFFAATLTTPVWVVVAFALLILVEQILVERQLGILRDLFRLYWKERYGEEIDEANPASPSPSETP